MPISSGDRLPDVTFRTMTADGPKPVVSAEFFGGKKMVLFGVPGAFTPTCHLKHLPGFVKEAEAFKAKGVDGIAVVAVNDPHVMGRWEKETGAAGSITFLADGNGEFAKAAGLDIDLAMGGLGIRNRRFAALIDDGVVKIINIEDAPGKAEISSAEALLAKM